jgi:hypothetical protein
MKGKVPLSILEELNPSRNAALRHVPPVDDQGAVLHLQGKGHTSEFFFKILKTENRRGGDNKNYLHYLVEFRPRSKGDTDSRQRWVQLNDAINELSTWLSIIEGYFSTKTILDDPLLESYEDQFYSQFEGLDDTAAQSGLSLEHQLKLNEYLTFVQGKVATLKEGRSAEDVAKLEEIEAEAKELQSNMTRENKGAIARRLARMWAKAQRVGLDVIKEIFVSVASEIATKMLTGKP